MEKKKDKLIIAGSQINLDSPDFEKVESFSDLSKLQIFSHLSASERASAETELFGKLEEKRQSENTERHVEDQED